MKKSVIVSFSVFAGLFLASCGSDAHKTEVKEAQKVEEHVTSTSKELHRILPHQCSVDV